MKDIFVIILIILIASLVSFTLVQWDWNRKKSKALERKLKELRKKRNDK